MNADRAETTAPHPRLRGSRLRACSVFTVAHVYVLVACIRSAHAEPRFERPNHAALTAAPFTNGAYDTSSTDGHFTEKGVHGWLARLEYRRTLTELIDVGTGAAYHQTESTQLIIPAALVRFALLRDETIEFGALLQLAYAFAHVETSSVDAHFSGPGIGVAVDLRARVKEPISVMVRAEVMAGSASLTSVSGTSASYFGDSTHLLWGVVAPTVGIDLAF